MSLKQQQPDGSSSGGVRFDGESSALAGEMTVLKKLTNLVLPPVLKMAIRKALTQIGPEVYAFIHSGIRSPLCVSGQLRVKGPSLACIDVSLDRRDVSTLPLDSGNRRRLSSASSALHHSQSRKEALKLLQLTGKQANLLCSGHQGQGRGQCLGQGYGYGSGYGYGYGYGYYGYG